MGRPHLTRLAALIVTLTFAVLGGGWALYTSVDGRLGDLLERISHMDNLLEGIQNAITRDSTAENPDASEGREAGRNEN